MTETYYPVLGRITLYQNDHLSKPLRLTSTALTDLQGEVRICDWKINDARTEVTLTIVNGGHLIHQTYPVEIRETALPSPGRSFQWSGFHGCWQHKKTGGKFKNA